MNYYVKKRLYFVIFITILVGTIGALLVWQLKSNMVFFYKPTDIIEKTIDNHKNIWLGGLVKDYQKKEEKDKILHIFTVTDKRNDIKVIYYGILPNLFKVNQGIVAYGKINKNMVLETNRVAVKHDEVYMTKEQYAKLRQ